MSEAKTVSEVTHDHTDPDDQETGQIVVTHEEVPITYHEYPNEWTFELFGKERKFNSLRECKDFINHPPKDADPARVFKHQAALLFGEYRSREDAKIVTVTSLCEKPDYDKVPRYWVTHPISATNPKKKRETVGGKSLFMDSPENKMTFSDIAFLNGQIEALEARREKACKKLVRFKPAQ